MMRVIYLFESEGVGMEIDWKFLIGDIVIPIGLFVVGFFVGRASNKYARSRIKGSGNTVVQNSKVEK